MNGKTIGYWATTGFFAFGMAAGGVFDLLLTPEMAASMEHLGYPGYFARILGFWKIAGVVALLVPGFTRLKEWAYAGFFFNLTGAMASHLAVGDGVGGVVAPLVLIGFGVASWALAPADRQLGARLPTAGGAPSLATA